ncbi:uncharacterized protein MONBRDRAFT_25808 [Monosiga brevicollis MX1]|uniref:Tim44-like domain-containing protein n=1 Tax=Monosiga brevicollis TaxID=81824 RepID=A9V0H7_MONBE|nr:uncharacterized protein MONBRDRAFT_25808 [Monosiga brevicollis MX1]EDQ89156.1 predicted protein [Monosiga brevicollis MX1]|eukprot:XP_001746261.1 hypothetical protein [Monosiga brevicollis MX1]
MAHQLALVPRRVLAGTTLASPLQLQTPAVFTLCARHMSFYGRKKKSMQNGCTHCCVPPKSAWTHAERRRGLMFQSKGQKAMMEKEGKEMMSALRQSNLGQIHDVWVPVPAEFSAPLLSAEGLRQRWEHLKKRVYSTYSAGMLRRNEKDWQPIPFAQDAQDKYIAIAKSFASYVVIKLGVVPLLNPFALPFSMSNPSKQTLRTLATDDCALRLRSEFASKPHTWKLLEVVERPQVVFVNLIPVNSKENLYAQITVKLHLKTELKYHKASQPVINDIPEYIVLERHIVDSRSQWKIAGNIMPMFRLPVEEQQRLRAQIKARDEALARQAKEARKAK